MPEVATRRDNTLETLLDERFDFPRGATLRDVYFVAFVQRSGSHLLCTRLWKTGVFGAPLEYFNIQKLPSLVRRFGVDYLDEYVTALLRHRTSPNGVFGLKLDRDQFAFLQLLAFEHPLRTTKWILVDRRDKHRQAISRFIALQTSAWSSLVEPVGEPVYDFAGIRDCLNALLQNQAFWQRYFTVKRIEPARIWYEDLVSDVDACVARVSRDLEIPLQPRTTVPLPDVERQSTRRNEEWLERFRSDLAAGSG